MAGQLAYNPLNATHCECLDKVLASIPAAMELAQACMDCGWDVSQFIEQLQSQQKMAAIAKSRFFPNQP